MHRQLVDEVFGYKYRSKRKLPNWLDIKTPPKVDIKVNSDGTLANVSDPVPRYAVAIDIDENPNAPSRADARPSTREGKFYKQFIRRDEIPLITNTEMRIKWSKFYDMVTRKRLEAIKDQVPGINIDALVNSQSSGDVLIMMNVNKYRKIREKFAIINALPRHYIVRKMLQDPFLTLQDAKGNNSSSASTSTSGTSSALPVLATVPAAAASTADPPLVPRPAPVDIPSKPIPFPIPVPTTVSATSSNNSTAFDPPTAPMVSQNANSSHPSSESQENPPLKLSIPGKGLTATADEDDAEQNEAEDYFPTQVDTPNATQTDTIPDRGAIIATQLEEKKGTQQNDVSSPAVDSSQIAKTQGEPAIPIPLPNVGQVVETQSQREFLVSTEEAVQNDVSHHTNKLIEHLQVAKRVFPEQSEMLEETLIVLRRLISTSLAKKKS